MISFYLKVNTKEIESNMQINKRIFLFFILLATGLAMTVAQAEPLSKGMGIVKRLSAEHGNDAKVSVQMRLAHTSSSRRSFQLGNKIHIEVSSPQSGFLYLLDINSKGQLTVIFQTDLANKTNI
ncbi:secreted protein [Beggiatoa sp. PS]|nr:secreted protein [Beggiatoa sp. PS]